jgi:rhodanese-related sulfurtransferase
MKKKTALLLVLAPFFHAFSQPKTVTDTTIFPKNSTYKSIYVKQACELIANNPDLLLLDVRSPGEYADTTRFISSRIGRLKGAINISIDSVTKHFNELTAYKDKTILVYCSHSNRSRVVSKRLVDSGFTNVYNLNGGMSEIDRISEAAFLCKSSLYTSNIPYKLMGPDDAADFIKDKNNIVLDVRPAAQFNGVDSLEVNNIGRIKTAINIPVTTFDNEMSTLAKYKDRPILIYDLYLSNAIDAALKLTAAGFKNISVLFDGLSTFLVNFPSSSKLRAEWIVGAPAYKLTGVREAIDLVNNTSNLLVADMRPNEQFENKAKRPFLNQGHIKNAINFKSVSDIETYLKDKPKNTPILLYGFFSPATMRGMAGSSDIDPSELSKKLAAEGYTNVYLLYDGIYSVAWSSDNVEGLTDAAGIIVDHRAPH